MNEAIYRNARIRESRGEKVEPHASRMPNSIWQCRPLNLEQSKMLGEEIIASASDSNIGKTPRQQNLWADSGSGSFPNV
jgi:hypothetical protein